jgi:Ras-related protein Rab-11A
MDVTGPKPTFKLVLTGATNVGKTNLLSRLTRDHFTSDEHATIGAAYADTTIHVDRKVVGVKIWDTAGSEKYRSVAPLYYRSANAALLVYDITSTESFEALQTFYNQLTECLSPQTPIMLVGNKVDLTDLREVPAEDGMAFASTHGLVGFLEASAKTGDNVKQAFTDVMRAVLALVHARQQTIAAEHPVIAERQCCA